MTSTINRPGMSIHLAQEILLDGIYQKSIDAADAKTKEEEEAAAAAVVAADEAAAKEGLFTKNLFENWIAPSDISTTEDADKVKARSLLNDAVILTSDGKMDDSGIVIKGAVEGSICAYLARYQAATALVKADNYYDQESYLSATALKSLSDEFTSDAINAQTKVETFLTNFETERLAEEPSSQEEAYSSLSKALKYINTELISYIKNVISSIDTIVISDSAVDAVTKYKEIDLNGLAQLFSKLSEFRIMIDLEEPEEDILFKGNFCAS